jgi:MFS family permease
VRRAVHPAPLRFLPTFKSIGIAAPILLASLRILQGFAIGGEYGGASIYVAEHAPADQRGYFTSFIQAGAPGGLLLSLIVSLGTIWSIGETAWNAWGWRIPFLFSIFLLGISLWMRLKLAESPVFKAMKEAGATARNPLKESLDSWPKVKSIFAVLIVTSGQSVIAYTAFFQTAFFLQNTLHLNSSLTRLIVIIATATAVGLYVLGGWLSDRLGRKKPIVIGYTLTILLLFPLFHFIASQANPVLTSTMQRSPVVVIGTHCSYNPFASKGQATACGKLLDVLSRRGVAYSKIEGSAGAAPFVTIGGAPVDVSDSSALTATLELAGYSADAVTPPASRIALIVLGLLALYALVAAAYGPMAAWLVELFPARVRYTSLSIPYHFGSGYAGGFLRFISQYIVAKTGDPFAGFWYAISVVTVALAVTIFFLPETSGKDLD